MFLFLAAVVVLLLGGLATLLVGLVFGSRITRTFGPAITVVGSVLGLAALVATSFSTVEVFQAPLHLPFGSLSFRLDALSRFFLLPVFVLAPLCAVYGRGYLGQVHEFALAAHWCFFNLTAAGMALVCAVDDGFLFLLCWEVMSLAPFFLVSFHDEKALVREAAWVYLVAAHLGAAVLLVLMVLLAKEPGSFLFEAWRSGAAVLPASTAGLCFCLALVGFGAKAGLAPLHVWLPEAHPAAPSHVSALMSGALVNAGAYGLFRFIEFLGPLQPWQGPLLLLWGLATALYAMFSALVQKDLKRLLALSTVENMGIVALGLGAGLTAQAAGHPKAALMAFAGAMLHVLNHTAFKGLLFLGVGAVIKVAGTAVLDALGGLGKGMPRTALCFVIGSAAIVGLPPFNGFAGEFLMYLSLAGGWQTQELSARLTAIAGLAGLASVGGLALACFARAHGMAFLGMPRTPAAEAARDPNRSMLGPMGLLAMFCTLGGLAAPWLFSLAASGAAPLFGASGYPLEAVVETQGLLWRVVLVAAGVMAAVAGIALLRMTLPGSRMTRRFRTWDCGYAEPTVRMQYSPSSFSHPLARMVRGATGLRRQVQDPRGFFPGPGAVQESADDLAREFLLDPLFRFVARLCDTLKALQHGRINLYILYIMVTLMALLIWKLR